MMVKSKKLIDPGPVSWTYSETIALINLIKDNTPLYDGNNKHYTNRQYIENIWRDIDIHFHKPPGTSHEKWSRLRVAYRKYKTNNKSDSKILWKFYNELDFLSPYLRKVPEKKNSLTESIEKILKTNNVINEGAESSDEIEIFVNCDDMIEVDTDRSLVDEEQTIDHSTEDKPNKRRKINVIKFEETKVDEIEINEKSEKVSEDTCLTENISFCNKNDPDIMYLNSLLPDIKLMSRKQKGLFKIKLQQLIHDMLYGDD